MIAVQHRPSITKVGVSLADAAETLRRQLEENHLDVTLAAAPVQKHAGHMIRVVQLRNPAWYRHLCEQYPSSRTRPRRRGPKYTDTAIKRRHVLRALLAIERGDSDGGGHYRERLLPYLRMASAWLMDPSIHSDLFEEL